MILFGTTRMLLVLGLCGILVEDNLRLQGELVGTIERHTAEYLLRVDGGRR